jgi:excisionase family DNA binding protein
MTDKTSGDDKTRLISLAEAAELYGFSQDYLGNLTRKGRLRAQKVGSMWVTTPADVEAYIQSRQEKGAYRGDIKLD